MANPAAIVCQGDIWTLVAQNVTKGMIYINDIGHPYLFTYVETGDPVPVDNDEAIPFDAMTAKIKNTAPIDVYVKPLALTTENGEVLVML